MEAKDNCNISRACIHPAHMGNMSAADKSCDNKLHITKLQEASLKLGTTIRNKPPGFFNAVDYLLLTLSLDWFASENCVPGTYTSTS